MEFEKEIEIEGDSVTVEVETNAGGFTSKQKQTVSTNGADTVPVRITDE